MKTTHTPGPWRADGSTVKAVSHGQWFKIARADGLRYTQSGNEANAEFIVRACNSHEELLAALESAEIRIKALSPAGYVAPELWTIRATVAKAKGE